MEIPHCRMTNCVHSDHVPKLLSLNLKDYTLRKLGISKLEKKVDLEQLLFTIIVL